MSSKVFAMHPNFYISSGISSGLFWKKPFNVGHV